MIPKILHLYWGKNLPLSWLRYLSVISWLKYNPDWQVIVGTPIETTGISRFQDKRENFYLGHDYLEDLRKIANVKIVRYDWTEYPFITTEVQRSDVYRWQQLPRYGGWWIDTDIIFFKPMIQLENFDKAVMQTYKNPDRNIHPIGFWGCPKNCQWIKDVEGRALTRLKASNGMQDGGCRAIPNKKHPEVTYISPDIVYPFEWDNLDVMMNSKRYNLPKACIGIHWFGGAQNTKELEKQMTPETNFDMNKNFHRIVKEFDKENK